MMFALGLFVAAQQLTVPAPAAASADSGTPVEIVLFSDFQCPFCARIAGPVREVERSGVDGVPVKVTFKNYPLPIHPRAPLAHRAALAAAEQGKFWEMHDLLFANQSHADRADLLADAKQLGLDVKRFSADLDSPRLADVIAADERDGTARRISGTPTFYVNGKEYVGAHSLDQLKQIVLAARHRARALAEVTDSMLSRGPANAPVVVELFADLQSGVSGPALGVLDQLTTRYPTAVRVQFRNFPLAFHPDAELAHEAAMTAAKSGRFWEFARYALAHQNALREQDLIALAGTLGLDQMAFATAIREHTYAARVEADVQAGTARGIRGSPVVVVNGKRIDGVPSLDALVRDVEEAMHQ